MENEKCRGGVCAGKTTYELYGPVNPFWSARYDAGMICFLQCLQEFADFAKARDVAHGHRCVCAYGHKTLSLCLCRPPC